VNLFEVIFEDAELLVINKPAGLVCHPTKTDEYSSLISRVRLYLGKAARPHLVNRLDRETSGVTIVAKTDESALELRRIWETRKVQKEYLAIVHGDVKNDRGLIDARLGKDERSRVAIKDCVREDGAEARTRYEVVKRFHHPPSGSFTLLRITLRQAASIRSAFIWSTWAIQSSATNFMAATKIYIWPWSKTGSRRNSGGG
jgi:23S rRNA pseudouridine1911/1915/1917 synthase